ncbi:MAG: glycosyltransferase family 1 protein [Synechococcales cyanobacterium CRU_2_2]|nr:glycosyltransferase family 1 protein [Synechococcales cyanobacterium CRU_2_2]
MRITILTVGSRGDIQPYLALALRLKAVGYEVCIATEQIYQAWITQEGIKYAFLPGNSKELHANEAWFKLLEETDSRPILSAYRAYREFLLPTLRELLDAAWEACQGSDVILSLPTVYAGSHIAEKLGIPCFTVWTCPFTPTRYFPHAWSRLPSQQWAGGALNRFSYWIPQLLDEKVLLPTINQWRQDTLGLPPVKTHSKQVQAYPTLYNYSAAVLAKPADWNDRIHLTGYWFLDRQEPFHPPDELVEFLADGPAPVYIGFGSIGDRNATRTLQIAVDAVDKSGQRAVLESGWAVFKQIKLPPQIFQLQSGAVPHAWLFPRMAALIHHGGAGTTAQASAAVSLLS